VLCRRYILSSVPGEVLSDLHLERYVGFQYGIVFETESTLRSTSPSHLDCEAENWKNRFVVEGRTKRHRKAKAT